MLTIFLLLLSILFIVFSTTRFHLHPFLALLAAAAFFGICSGMPLPEVIRTINDGFGATMGNIGIIIIAGIIIGTFLENSGGAYRLADFMLRLIGRQRVHTAMAVIGYLVSIPVFADSGFIILSSLNKALTKKAGVSLAGTAIALSLGLMASHTMVPPTPGPIAAAGIIGADLGLVILTGLYASIGGLVVVTIFAEQMGRRIRIDADPELNAEIIEERTKAAPSALKSFLPIITPIILIVLRSVAEYPTEPFGNGMFKEAISFAGNPVVALTIGMLLSFLLPKKLDRRMLGTSGWVGTSLQSAAVILLITGAGGAFGKVLQASDMGSLLGGLADIPGLGIWLPFLAAAVIKSAQGSSTVAIITTASLVAPLLVTMGMDSGLSKAMVVIAIGAGSAVTSHANDSFFWVVSQMSNMSVKQAYQLQSVGSALLGFSSMLLLAILDFFI